MKFLRFKHFIEIPSQLNKKCSPKKHNSPKTSTTKPKKKISRRSGAKTRTQSWQTISQEKRGTNKRQSIQTLRIPMRHRRSLQTMPHVPFRSLQRSRQHRTSYSFSSNL